MVCLCFLLGTGCTSIARETQIQSSAGVTLENFQLTGDLSGERRAAFNLTAIANVNSSKGATLELLSGAVALTDIGPHPDYRIRIETNRFVLIFDRKGKFPVRLAFDAAVKQSETWKSVDFSIAPGLLQPLSLAGLGPDTKFEFAGASRPERKANEFQCYLPADGAVKFSWKEAKPEAEGKLFYAAEMLSQISVSPGLLRQVALLDCRVMQGELNRVVLRLHGAGEVTRVQGDQVLAWNLDPVPDSPDRRLIVQFNQPQKEQFSLQIQVQTPLEAFPQTVDAMQLRPEGATRFAGYFRIVNEGAVRLEVAKATGLSQVSPEQFPETETTRAALRFTGSQRFAYRFSGPDFALRIQADQILPELSVSQVLTYRLGESESDIDAEIELDVREAPLRDLVLRVPKGYLIARLNASGLSDYFLREPQDETNAELRLVYGQPVSGRQLIQLRLERNQPLGETTWALPRIDIPKAKSVRGHVGAASDAGIRLTPERTQSLSEIATAFFPRKIAGLQSAFRLSDAEWQASLRVERLPQSVQADALHLFSVGEGIAYGSSIINYVISGAPVSAFKVGLSDEYFNVEFTGKDIRAYQKTEGGYLVQLHTPVSGSYTLLASYERPFKSQGETLAFTGARSLDAQSEQGYTLVISAYQFQVKPAEVSPGLLSIETGEVPPEYRLFFDAPILAAYRYTSRPFNLRLALSPLAQGDSLSLVVDRARLVTHISKEGQALTEASYFVKNRGNPNLRLTLPKGAELWSVNVNDAPVVPVLDGQQNLIPLPQRADPNAILKIDLKLAAPSKEAGRVSLTAPTLSAPVMLAEWKIEPDTGQKLLYRAGSLTPLGGVADISGFAQLARALTEDEGRAAVMSVGTALLLLGASLVLWRSASRKGVFKFSVRHVLGTAAGLLAVMLAGVAFGNFWTIVQHYRDYSESSLTFLAPVQQSGTALTAEVLNIPAKASLLRVAANAWPALLALALWLYGWASERRAPRTAGWIFGWLMLAWAALRSQNGAEVFLFILVAFLVLHVLVPALRQLWRLPVPPVDTAPSKAQPGGASASAATALLIGGLVLSALSVSAADRATTLCRPVFGFAESVVQDIRVEEKFALATAKIRWQAERGQSLPLLAESAVLTRLSYPSNALKIVQLPLGSSVAQQLLAEKSGTFDLEVRYEVQVSKRDGENGFTLPLPSGLINRLNLSLVNLDVDVLSPQAVSVTRESVGSNTVATLTLSPANESWVGWKPRSRDVKREKPVFYAEATQLYAPAAGVIEGAHYIFIRPAQGELRELTLDVPPGVTITDVLDPAKPGAAIQAKDGAARTPSLVSLWRFDPDARKLRVTLSPAQSRPFAFVVRSQSAVGPLPFEHSVGLLSVDNAAGQIGMLGLATGNEVQLESAKGDEFSSVNLEDFSGDAVTALQAQLPGLTVRRAFRYSNTHATAALKAVAVEPDIRVETQDTLSLGEDRCVLAVNANVNITRAGIFRLSFVMPAGCDVESISGSALSHWTESKTDDGRIITLHLPGKTEGEQQFAISLAASGIKTATSWPVPQVVLREASKQRGTLLLVPEQGMRLQVADRDGVTQLDPQKSGIRQKGVLAFRILQTPWKLSLGIEQVDAWVQVTSLQQAVVNEAQVKVTANLQYQIENTGLKSLRLFLPTNAESVRFQGDQVADFVALPNSVTNGLQGWEVKLHRRVLGPYMLHATYQVNVPQQETETLLRGVQADDVNLQRGFVTVQSGGRLQVRIDRAPEALQPSEWQSIPRPLLQDVQTAAANFTFRLVEPSFQLPLKLERHEAARLLPARVNNVSLSSVISDAGVMLTHVRLDMLPGDAPLLSLTLPKDANFWFAFVNQNGVWPWRKEDQILLPLEPQSRHGQTIPVELFYSCRIGSTTPRALDLELLAPKFDLPLENITWRVSISDKWKVKHWSGTLQLQQEEVVSQTNPTDLAAYLSNENALGRERTKEAETLMAAANTALDQGNPQQARRAFQAAYGLSAHDPAFNEDARVQLHNIKLQEALVGLNVRQASTVGESSTAASKFRDLRGRKELTYTQQDAKDIIDQNSAEENAAYMRLAERLIQQQDAAVSAAAPIRASIPQQGRVLTFTRAVAVDKWANLEIGLKAAAAGPATLSVRSWALVLTLAVLGIFGFAGRSFRPRPSEA